MAQLAKIETAKVTAGALAGIKTPTSAIGGSVSHIKTDDIVYQRFGLVVLVLIFGVFILWSVFAPLGSYAVASGKVVVDIKKQIIQHREGGSIQDIFVKDGDQVSQGQKLLEISSTDAQAEKSTLQEQLLGNLGLEARLNTEMEGQTSVVFPSELANSQDPRALEITTDEKQHFTVRQRAAAAELEVLEQRRRQLQEQIIGVENQASSQRVLAKTYQKELSELEKLNKRQLVSDLQLTETERRYLSVQAGIAELDARKAAFRAEMSELEGQKVLQINTRRKEVAAQLAEVRVKIADLRSRLTAATDRLQRTVIVAPEAGTVVGLAFNTKGGVVKPGEILMELVPAADKFEVEAEVAINDIDKVHVGLVADIRFPAFALASLLKPISGEVVHVSADTFVDDADRRRSYYRTRIQIAPEGVAELMRHNLHLNQGMPAEVSIKSGDRTLLEYLLAPMNNMLNHAFNED